MAIFFTGCASGIFYGQGQTPASYKQLPVFAVQNARGSKRLVTLKRANIMLESGTVAQAVVKPNFKSYRVYDFDPFDGGCDLLAKCPFDTSQTSDDFVRIWIGNSTSPGSLSRWTGTVATTAGFSNWSMRMHDLTGQIQECENHLIPMYSASPLTAGHTFILYPGETYYMTINTTVALQDPPNNFWQVNALWTEETLPTYTISGTVKDGATNITGAKIFVMVADTNTFTNLYHWDTVTSSAGTWTCDVPAGKWSFAHCQYNNAGTYYTSTGAPFLS